MILLNKILFALTPFFYCFVINTVYSFTKVTSINDRASGLKDTTVFNRILWFIGTALIAAILSIFVSIFLSEYYEKPKTEYFNLTVFLMLWLPSVAGIIKCLEMSFEACKQHSRNIEQNNSNYIQW
ncbi:hypothetical protein [Pedobacter hartonius]|nr:hypothetical protein [Pedobacter hartonius]